MIWVSLFWRRVWIRRSRRRFCGIWTVIWCGAARPVSAVGKDFWNLSRAIDGTNTRDSLILLSKCAGGSLSGRRLSARDCQDSLRDSRVLAADSPAHACPGSFEARECFDYLLDSGAPYVVVLNEDDTIAGIVTKTSVARSVASSLWGTGEAE